MPLVPLAEAARRRGHDVWFASGEPALTKARALGFHSERAGLDLPESQAALAELLRVVAVPLEQRRAFAVTRWYPEIEAEPRLVDLERIREQFRPDALVHEVSEVAGPLAAAAVGIPWITVGYGPLRPPGLSQPAAEALAPIWRSRGLEVPANAGLYEYLYVDPFPLSMQIAAIDALPAVIRLRPSSAGVDLPFTNRPEPGRVYLTYGSLANQYDPGGANMRVVLAGIADVAREVVVTLGANADPARLGPVPSHVDVRLFVPQDEILPRCAATVSHGGAGTLMGALAWGVPSLLLPMGADQFDNAERALAGGAALVLPPDEMTRDAVADGVHRLLTDPTAAPGIGQIRAELAAAADAGMIIERIETLAKT